MKPVSLSLSILILFGACKTEPSAPANEPFVVSNVVCEQANKPSDNPIQCFAVSGTNLFAGIGNFGNGVGGLFLSTNNGSSWSTSVLPRSVHCLFVFGHEFFCATEGGIFLSANNGTNWTEVDSGLSNNDVWSLAVSGTNFFAGTYGGGIFLSTNNGTNWTATGAKGTVSALVVSNPYVFAGTYDGEVFIGVMR